MQKKEVFPVILSRFQEVQDCFASVFQITLILVDKQGNPLTKISKPNSLCDDIVRKCEAGMKNCSWMQNELMKSREQGVVIQRCKNFNLLHAGIRMGTEENYFGILWAGQVREVIDYNIDWDEKQEIFHVPKEEIKKLYYKIPLCTWERLWEMCYLLFNTRCGMNEENYSVSSEKFPFNLGLFSRGLSHNLNNLLAGLQGYLELTRLEETMEYLPLMEEIIDKTALLVRKIQKMSLGRNFPTKRVNLSELFTTQAEKFQKTLKDNITLIVENNISNAEILGDEENLSQMLNNILLNSLESIKDQGKIYLRLFSDNLEPGRVVLECEDTGLGIEENNVSKIFDPFYTRKKDGEVLGRGMGLTVVQGIVREHQGRIQVHSKKDAGTCVSISFDLLSEMNLIKTENNRAIRVMIIDDENDFRGSLIQILKHYKLECTGFSSGKDALKSLSQNKNNPDIIILDMVMSEMDGLKVFQEIRKIHKKIPVIISTGIHYSKELKTLLSEGNISYLPKPYSVRSLVTSIQSLQQKDAF